MEYREIYRDCIICGTKAKEKGNDETIIWDGLLRLNQNKLDCMHVINISNKFYHMQVVICPTCGLLYTNPMMDSDSLDKFYEGQYRKIYTLPHSSVHNAHAKSGLNTLNEVEKVITFRNVLDVGCGPEFVMIKALKEIGLQADGLDTDLSIPGIYHSFDELSAKKWDIVTCFNTLEHVYDPIGFLKDLRRYVSKALIVGVPNIYSTEINVTVDTLFSKAHLWHFSTNSLSNIMRLAGYKVVRMFGRREPMCGKIHIVAQKMSDKISINIKKPDIEIIKQYFSTMCYFQYLQRHPKIMHK